MLNELDFFPTIIRQIGIIKKKCYYSTELQILDAKQAQNTQISIVIVAIRIFPYRHTLRNEYLLDLHNKRPLFKLVVQFLYTQCYSNA